MSKLAMVSAIVAAFLLLAMDASVAKNGNGAYCKGMVDSKHMKSKEDWHNEYNKCISDPQNYK